MGVDEAGCIGTIADIFRKRDRPRRVSPAPSLIRSLTSLPMLLALRAARVATASTTVTLQPDATAANCGDAFVTTGPGNDLKDNNYGATGAVAISASGLAAGEFRSLLRFDLATALAA